MLIFLFAVVFSSHAFSAEEKIQPKEIVKILMSNQDFILPKTDNSGCKMTDLPNNAKIRDYVTFLMATLAEAKDGAGTQSISAKCEAPKGAPLKMPAKPDLYWDCEVYFNTVNKGSGDPWNYGIVFRVAKKNHKMEKTPLACPGTP